MAVGTAAAVPAALGVRYVAQGTFDLRDRMLDAVRWHGDETVGDLGSAAGLLGLAAAPGATTLPRPAPGLAAMMCPAHR